MKELKEKILNIIFLGDYEQVIGFCDSLSEKERKDIFKDFKPVFSKIKEICTFNFDSYQLHENTGPSGIVFRSYKTKEFLINDVLKLFLESEDLEKTISENKINIQANSEATKVFIRNQMFQIMLTERKSILQLMKINRNDSIVNYDSGLDKSFIYNAVNALLHRKEEWKIDLICEYFENIEKYNQNFFYQGFYQTVNNVIKYYPEKEELKNYLAKAVYLETMRNDLYNLNSIKPEILLLAIDYQITNERVLNLFPAPVSIPYINDEIIKLIETNYLPRTETLDLTLRNLLSQNKQGSISGWVKIYNLLKPEYQEILDRKNIYINLINSVSSQGKQIALAGIKEVLNDIQNEYENLITVLVLSLNDTVQKVSKGSFNLLKTLAKDKKLKPIIIDKIIENIYIPNQSVRLEALKWIQTQNITDIQKNNIISFFKDSHDLLDKQALKELFGEISIVETLAENISINHQEIETSIIDFHDKSINKKYLHNYNQMLEKLNNNSFDLNLERIKGNLLNYNLEEKLNVFDNAIEFAEYLSLSANNSQNISILDLENIFATVLKFKNTNELNKITKILDPCLKAINKLEIQQKEFGFWGNVIKPNNLLACLSAYLWINKKIPKDNKAIEAISRYGNYFANKRIQSLEKYLKIENVKSLLSTPDYINYWIEAESFAKHLLDIPLHQIDFNDLFVALFRIAPDNHSKAWELIHNLFKIEDKESLIKDISKNKPDAIHKLKVQSVVIALAPLAQAKEALKLFIDYLEKNPSNDFILHNDFNATSLYNDNQDTNNQIFRLLNAALKCRYNLENPFIELPELENVNINNLQLNLGINTINYHKELQESFINSNNTFTYKSDPRDNYKINKRFKELNKTEQQFIRKIIFYPYKINKENVIHNFGSENFRYITTDLLYYQNLEHYYSSFDYSGFQYLEADVEKKVAYFPAIAQRLFDVAILNAEKIKNESRYYEQMLSVSRFGTIDISEGIDTLFFVLAEKKIQDKEQVMNIIFEDLKKGQLNFTDIINNLENLFHQTKGFKYIIESVKYLNACSETFERLTILAIENYLGRPETNSKNISVLGDLMIELMSKYPRKITNRSTLKLLTDTLNSKKSSSFKSKAKIINELNINIDDNFEKLTYLSLLKEISG